MVAGIGSVNGDDFSPSKSRCVVMSYDYTVLAGTQGAQNHRKKDRMFELAERMRLPVVFFTEGGGGRPGDTDGIGVAGLDCLAFQYFGQLSGLVPLVGITSGRCFAGNAAMLGCCDVVIATKGSNIGMGGPAMIEGGGLGIFRPARGRPARRADRERRRRHRRRGRARSRARREAIPRLLPGLARALGVRGPALVTARDPREPPAHLRRAPRDRDPRRRRLACSSCGAASGTAW